MIGYVLIGLWTFFSWNVIGCKSFGMYIVNERAEKIRFNFKMIWLV